METTETFVTAPVMSAPSPTMNTVAQVTYAGFWKRVGAALIDGMLTGAVTWIIALVFGGGAAFMGAFSGIQNSQLDPDKQAAFVASMIALYVMIIGISMVGGWLYYAFMESSSKQATIGKMALGIRVTDLEGNRVSFARASGRFFGRILSSIMGIGYLMAAFTEKKQALHDMIAGTLVVNK